jgi:hypothetical protein
VAGLVPPPLAFEFSFALSFLGWIVFWKKLEKTKVYGTICYFNIKKTALKNQTPQGQKASPWPIFPK